MQIKVCFTAYNIDDFKRKWLARSLFLILIVLGALARLFPVGDSDLSGILNYSERLMNGDIDYINLDMNEFFRLYGGNLLYSLSIIFYDFLYICVSVITAAVVIREKRTLSADIKAGKIVGRVIVMLLFIGVLYPFLYSVTAGFTFILAFIIGLAGFFVASYCSGEFSFGRSFGNAFRLYKNNLFTTVLNFILFFFVFSLIENMLTLVRQNDNYDTIFSVIYSSVAALKYFIGGRLTGILYTDSKK